MAKLSAVNLLTVPVPSEPHPLLRHAPLAPLPAANVYARSTVVDGFELWRFWLSYEDETSARVLPLGDADLVGYGAEDERAIRALWSAYPSLKRAA